MEKNFDTVGDRICKNCEFWKRHLPCKDYGPCSDQNIVTKESFTCSNFSKHEKFKKQE